MGKLGRRALVLLVACSLDARHRGLWRRRRQRGQQQQQRGGRRKGGSITISQTSQPDYLDPALSYTVNGWEPLSTVYSGLIGYKRADGQAGSELIPVLAQDMPKVSKDGTTYELTLRKGLKYSDGTPVKASDFEHSIQRVLNLESGGSAFFLGIKGAEDYVEERQGRRPTSRASRPTTRPARSRSR